MHPELAAITSEGVPDVRIVVYRGVPVMAMTRLPTLRSGGRANLHQGAVAAGIDLESGLTTHAILHSQPIEQPPGHGRSAARPHASPASATRSATRCAPPTKRGSATSARISSSTPSAVRCCSR